MKLERNSRRYSKCANCDWHKMTDAEKQQIADSIEQIVAEVKKNKPSEIDSEAVADVP